MSLTVLMPVTHRNPSTTCTPATGSKSHQDQMTLPQAHRNQSIKEKGEIGGVSGFGLVFFFFNKAIYSYFLYFPTLLHKPAAGFCQGTAPCWAAVLMGRWAVVGVWSCCGIWHEKMSREAVTLNGQIDLLNGRC